VERVSFWTAFPTGAGAGAGAGNFFLFTTASRPALGPTQLPIQWVRGSFSLEVKRTGCAAENSPPSSAEVKSVRSCISIPP
jgi:hypothetical protein